MPTPTDSRLGTGTLTLGTTDFGVQIANVLLRPSHAKTDGTPTLGNPTPSPDVETTWALVGNAIQDWQDDAGIIEYLRANNNTTVAFSWTPNATHGVVYSGTCKVYAVEIGGDVAKQNTSAFEFDVVGTPSRAATGAVPSAPLNLQATAESATVVVLDWEAPISGNPTSYKVYTSATEGGSYTEVTTNISKVGTTARLTSLTTNTTYWYKVAAVNGSGTGVQSAADSVTTP
jgi:hypothetical protein